MKKDKILIRGGRIIDPSIGKDKVADLYIADGIIQSNIPHDPSGVRIIDAGGKIVAPGLIDMHVHLRDPGLTHKEDITSGLIAASKGGFSTVVTMANTIPVTDRASIIDEQIHKACRRELGRLYPVSSVTLGMEGKRLVDIESNINAGAVAFSEDGKSVENPELLKEFMIRMKQRGCLPRPILDHCDADKKDEKNSEAYYAARDIKLAAQTGARLHIQHVSTKDTVDIIREAKRDKRLRMLITAEAAPHHFTLTEEDIKVWGTNAKMSPPLRTAEDRDAIIRGLQDGTIDAIATDHAPHAEHEKAAEFANAPNGIIGLETAVGLAFTELVHTNKMSESDLIKTLTTNPARILNLDTIGLGTLFADLTIIDPNKEWTVNSADFASKSKNMPYEGKKLKGAVTHTICRGRLIFDATEK